MPKHKTYGLTRRESGPYAAAATIPHRDAQKMAVDEALNDLGSVVYFVAIHELVKIGYTTNLRNRLACYGVPRTALLAVIPGGRPEEIQHHERFAADLARGREWFRPSAELMCYVNDLRAAAGVGPVPLHRFVA